MAISNNAQSHYSTIEALEDIRESGLQETFDNLYKMSSKHESFTNLFEIIFSIENIDLANKIISKTMRQRTAGSDKIKYSDIKKISLEEIQKILLERVNDGYKPKTSKIGFVNNYDFESVEIGIPSLWDRFIQVCIANVIEPICEARFSTHSYAYRLGRSLENAVAEFYRRTAYSKLYHVVSIKVDNLFNEVNHSKLIKQLWALGIHDKKVIYLIKQILKAPIKDVKGVTTHPTKGLLQTGMLSKILFNVHLNEFDHWIMSQWEENPVHDNYIQRENNRGSLIKSHGYRAMRNTNLKEMFVIRYYDDIQVICNNKADALKVNLAIQNWFKKRLKYNLTDDVVKITDMRKKFVYFVGFKIKVVKKRNKYVTFSCVAENQAKIIRRTLKKQIMKVARPKGERTLEELIQYNFLVSKFHKRYMIATNVATDFEKIGYPIYLTIKTKFRKNRKPTNSGRGLTLVEKKYYAPSAMFFYDPATKSPVYPVMYVSHRNPRQLRVNSCPFTDDGRKIIYVSNNIAIDECKN